MKTLIIGTIAAGTLLFSAMGFAANTDTAYENAVKPYLVDPLDASKLVKACKKQGYETPEACLSAATKTPVTFNSVPQISGSVTCGGPCTIEAKVGPFTFKMDGKLVIATANEKYSIGFCVLPVVCNN